MVQNYSPSRLDEALETWEFFASTRARNWVWECCESGLAWGGVERVLGLLELALPKAVPTLLANKRKMKTGLMAGNKPHSRSKKTTSTPNFYMLWHACSKTWISLVMAYYVSKPTAGGCSGSKPKACAKRLPKKAVPSITLTLRHVCTCPERLILLVNVRIQLRPVVIPWEALKQSAAKCMWIAGVQESKHCKWFAFKTLCLGMPYAPSIKNTKIYGKEAGKEGRKEGREGVKLTSCESCI